MGTKVGQEQQCAQRLGVALRSYRFNNRKGKKGKEKEKEKEEKRKKEKEKEKKRKEKENPMLYDGSHDARNCETMGRCFDISRPHIRKVDIGLPLPFPEFHTTFNSVEESIILHERCV